MYKIFLIILFLSAFARCTNAQEQNKQIIVAAEQPDKYLHLLSKKETGLMVNHTSLVDTIHLLDFLLSKGIMVKTVFAVEHGFRGDAPDGELIDHSTDSRTGVPIISLYGSNKKATDEQMSGLDAVVFDIQDVGCRFYTYISSLHYMMEACAENNIELIVLDRPNPNGDYIAGPVLDMSLKSFVGMHPIPIVHGCTVGELALMINAEGWLDNGKKCELTVIPVENYTHSNLYRLPVKPSPNLPSDLSVRLYPSLCFFEATNVSIGRGTPFPFQVIGFPDCPIDSFSFTPQTIEGMSKNPLHENKLCHGIDLRNIENAPKFTLKYFQDFFELFDNAEKFWKSRRWIDLLSGDKNFYDQINNRKDAEEIEKTWQDGIEKYKVMRKQYLLYPDFE
jgi:uncharacterized protein YbbC (DUF1343 family)